MAALFFLFVIDMIFIGMGWQKSAIILTLITLLLCLTVFWHHWTLALNIRL